MFIVVWTLDKFKVLAQHTQVEIFYSKIQKYLQAC